MYISINDKCFIISKDDDRGIEISTENNDVKNHILQREGVYLYKLIDGEIVQTTDTEKAEQYKAVVIQNIKAEAERIILQRYPLTTQTNAERRGMLLLEKMIKQTITPEEETEREEIRAAGEWIDSIRAQSNDMEASLEGMTYDELKTFVPQYNTGE